MQTKEPTQFRFNLQVGVIFAITSLALVIPLAVVAIAFRDVILPPQKEIAPKVPEPATEALAGALGSAADKNLAPETLSSGDRVVIREVADIAHERQRIEKLAQAEGALALPSSSGAPESISLLIQLPAGREEAFLQACKGLLPDESPAASVPDKEARILVEVVIKQKSP